MALIKCVECGREISDAAAMCPGCGHPLELMSKSSRAPTPTPGPATAKSKSGGGLPWGVILPFFVLGLLGTCVYIGVNLPYDSGCRLGVKTGSPA